jgi:hypothetical protein
MMQPNRGLGLGRNRKHGTGNSAFAFVVGTLAANELFAVRVREMLWNSMSPERFLSLISVPVLASGLRLMPLPLLDRFWIRSIAPACQSGKTTNPPVRCFSDQEIL